MLKLSRTEAGKAAIFAAAGVYTSPTFMEDILAAAVQLLEHNTRLQVARSGLSFPYGDWSCGLLKQIRQVRRDMSIRRGAFERSIGGRSLIGSFGDLSGVDALLLIGHSGGGVAAVHAASLLGARLPGLDVHIVQIGCPRSAVPPELQARVRYLYAVHPATGAAKDPICRIGSWGGWERSGLGVPRWNPLKLAPGLRAPVPIIGGHADYFRDRPPFRNEDGRTNLELVNELLLAGLIDI
ncbi:hypothetical protein FE783_02565 [Paenibacillus mesophilus]|uniref:hypothetical protein n=1 Tax=Paenibacillus mesophilus TaxID=2582849 RepID=UPI00110EAE64|nr:hypothetical protein [Paenibacillus mesophilus]TMV53086.1 hypothetical protein FE783_02565 [Paenibacillus mesophilus]